MTIERMEHVRIVVDDLAAATAFFVELGLKLQGEGPVEGGRVDRVVGLEGVRAQIAMVKTPDGHGRLELTKFTPRRAGAATGTRRRAAPRASRTVVRVAASKDRQASCGVGAYHHRRRAKRCHAMEGSMKIFGS
jgi:catechol 2,3-dioxygenase-like lactoylglutathione lyase family enzyme